MSDHLITKPPGVTTCHRCGRSIFAATIGGLDRHIDRDALTPAGMLRATEAGIPLFLLRGHLLYTLAPEHFDSGQPLTVLPEHTCRPIPSYLVDSGGVHMEAAVALATQLLGATPVVAEVNHTPPF